MILSFHTERRDLEKRMPVLRERMEQNAGLWIAWPKRASKEPTDITEDVVREIALATGSWTTKSQRWTKSGAGCGW